MKIIHQNKKEGRIKVKPEVLDDLWYLKSIIGKGDLVKGKGYRRVKPKEDEKLRPEKGERKPMTLELEVDDVEFHPSMNRLRVTGVIKAGPVDLISLGSHHTLEVQPNDVMTIRKEWKRWQLDRLKEAEKSSRVPLVLIVSIEEGEAELALVRRYGLDFVARITTPVSGKRYEKEHEISARDFYGDVAGKLPGILKKEDIKAVIIGGPGFAKEHLLEHLKDKYPEVAEICHLEGTGSGGKPGVHEVLKRGAVARVVEESRVSLETTIMEKVFEEISKDEGLVLYGSEEVRKGLGYGAVETLLLSDEYLRTKECDGLIEEVKKAKGEVVIVSMEHEAGERLQSLSGIAALLRFKIK